MPEKEIKPSQRSLATLETQDLVKEAIMSDTQVGEAPASQFTPKEQALLIAAMSSLKSGPPELDMDLFVRFGNFTAKKTAQNQWGLLKKKLLPRPAEGEEGYKAPSPTTPKKTPAKKRTKKESDDEEVGAEGGEVEGSAMKKAKTPRKTPAKKGKKVSSEDGPADDQEEPTAEANAAAAGSPKKKKAPAKPRVKKAPAVKEEQSIAEETEPVKAEEETDVVESKETSMPPPAIADGVDVEMGGADAAVE